MKTIKNLLHKNRKNIAKYLFILIVVYFILLSGFREFRQINFKEIADILQAIPFKTLIFFLLFGIFAIGTMTLYDLTITNYLGLDIDKPSLFAISFLASSINNFSGLGGVTGATIRSVILKNSINDKDDLLNYNLLLVPATGVGLSLMSLISLLNKKIMTNFYLEFKWIYLIALAYTMFLLVYFLLEKIINLIYKKNIFQVDKKRFKVKFILLLVSLIEWSMAFLLFYSISNYIEAGKNVFGIFASFTLASITGILSLIPGGIGSFDLFILLGLQFIGFSREGVLTILIIYRIFYYILPIVISIIFTLVIQTQGDKELIKLTKTKDFIKKTSKVTNMLLALLIFFSGVTLLIDGLFPYMINNMDHLPRLVPYITLELSHHISISIGIVLIIISNQIRMKVKRSYKLTMYLIFLGIITSLIKNVSYIRIAYLVGVLILLYLSKNSFYRKSTPINWLGLISTLVFSFIAIYIYTKTSNIVFKSFLKFNNINLKVLKNFKFKGLVTSSIFSYTILLIMIVYYSLTKEKIYTDERYESLDKERLTNFLKSHQGNTLTHLAYMGDKKLFWAEEDNFLIQYEVGYNKVIVLGDPMGSPEFMEKGIKSFLSFIDLYGYKSVFYQVSDEHLSFYHDNGYYLFKLGETGLVNLNSFDLTGSKSRDFRNTMKRFEKDGYVWEFKEAGTIDPQLYISLKELSDQWLNGRDEMSFSLGAFHKDYLETCDLSLIRHSETGRIIAFSTMIPSYDGKTFSIDLMRLRNDTPNNTMNFLIINLLLHYKNLGYEYFNLGMAPLSNVGTNSNAHTQEKLAHLVFEYGNYFYSFQGLRNFKNKFKPDWKARYLVYEDIASLPQSLLEVTILIHK